MKRLLFLMLGIISALGMRAQTWTAPTLEYPFEGDEPVAEESYVFFNTKAGLFLTGAGYWGVQTSLVTEKEGTVYPSVFQVAYDEDEEGWTFLQTTNVIHRDNKARINTYMFRAADNTAYFDMGSQGNNFWTLREQGNNVYRIQTNELNGVYGRDALDAIDGRDYDKEFLGWGGDPSDMIVYTNIDPEAEGVGVDWLIIQDGKYTKEQINEFLNVTRALFSARLDLYSRAKTIVDEELDVNYEAYTEVYNNGSIEDINAAIAELDDKIQVARVYAVLKYGEDGTNPPSETNPCDATSLIKNAAFDEGEQWQLPPYWTVDPMGQNNCWNGDTYTNDAEGITVKGFMESWIGAPTTLKDGGMYQVMKALPLGKYELGVDAKATLQSAALPFQVEGVELFATGGDFTTTIPINTPDNLPLHFTMTFANTGGDVTLGLRTRNANVNWMLADNFTLTYYGNGKDVYLLALELLIEKADATYSEDVMENMHAYMPIINTFKAALKAAKTEVAKVEDPDYAGAYNNLKLAMDNLPSSIDEYNWLNDIYNKWNDRVSSLSGKWQGISESTFADTMDEISNAYYNGTYNSEQIAAADSRLAEAFSMFIGSLVAHGDDLTFLLNNPSFDDKDANGNYIKFSGWDSEWVSPTWGGEDVQYADPADPTATKIAEGGNAEVYHAKFDIHQTIKYMPAGVFTLSCKAFERDDNSQGVDTELYAIVNGDIQNIQTVKVKNRNEEGSDVMLYDGTGGTNGKNADVINGDKYVPSGMSGANVYFNEGFYENYLNIVLEEPAEEIIIGIRNLTGGETWNSNGDWVLFDDFQIIFNGNSGSSYFPTLQRLIDKANTYTAAGAEYILTTEALNALANAIKNAQDLMENEEASTESALDVIAQLEEAIELTKETIALTDELNHYIEVMDLRMWDDLIATSDTSIEDVISEIRGHLDNSDFTDKAAVEQAMIDLNKAFTKYVMYDHAGATEANPANVTPVIYNYDGNEYSYSTTVNGWDQIEGTVGYGNSGGEVSELYNTKFEISQTLYGLLPGWYRLGVQGYYRAGLGTAVKEQYEAGQELARHAILFAGDEAETALLGITNMEDMIVFTQLANDNGTNGTVALVAGDETYRIPDTAAQGATALQNFREDETPLYQNYLLFEVKEGQESVTIGLRKTEEVEKDLCIWDNWSLLYYGTGQSQEPIIDPDAGVDFGGAVTAIEADTWYYLYQARGGGSYCMEGEIPSGGGGLMTDCGNGEEVLKKDFTPLLSHVSTETAAPYLVRFVKEDETDDVYRIQFGTGNWLAAPNGTGNGKKFTTSSTINDAGTFNVYAIEEGTAYFALNVCDDRGDYQELLDNNGTGSYIATWDSGKKTNVGGNSVWSIHEVIITALDEKKILGNELADLADEISAAISNFVGGTLPGCYDSVLLQALQDLIEEIYLVTPDGPDYDATSIEQLQTYIEQLNQAYQAVLASKVPFTLTTGYYRIKSAMAFTQDVVVFDEETGEETTETKIFPKYMMIKKNGETINGVWGTPENLDVWAPALWYITSQEDGTFDVLNVNTQARFNNISQSAAVTLSKDSENRMTFDPVATDENGITYVDIRVSTQAANDYFYLHAGGHGSGAGISGNLVGWATSAYSDGTFGATEWAFEAITEAEAQKIIKNYEPYEKRDLLLEQYDNLLAVAKEDLETAIDIQHVKLIQSADQLSSPCSDSEEGQHIENLIDENTSTFWYSDWHGDYEGGTHYFQVEMPENITMPIHATFTRRNSSVYQITQWGIYGTNNADAASMEDCELLLEWDTPFNSQTETLTSPEFETKGYKYLRMYCLAQSKGAAFFHLSEFQLGYDAENPEAPFYYMGEVGKNLQQVIEAQAELERDDITLDDYNVLKAAHDAFLDKLSWMDYPIVNLLDGNAYDFDTDTDVKRVTYTRNYKNKNWQALYLPFEIDYEDWANDFDLARINDTHQFDDDDDGVIDRTELEVIKLRSGHTEAHTPYLIRAKKTGEKTIMANCTTLYAAEERSYDVSSWNTLYTFTGTYTGVPGETMLGNGYYAFGGGSLHQAADVTNALSPYRWYMEITDRNGNPKNLGEVKVVVFDMDDMDETDEADGIKWQMSNGKCEMEHGDGALYDLSGRRVTNPRQGIYVRNGRKIIIK